MVLELIYFSVCNSPTEHTCCCYCSSKNTLSKFPRKLNGMKFYGAHTHPLLPDVNWILTLNVKYFEERLAARLARYVQLKWRFPFNEWKFLFDDAQLLLEFQHPFCLCVCQVSKCTELARILNKCRENISLLLVQCRYLLSLCSFKA